MWYWPQLNDQQYTWFRRLFEDHGMDVVGPPLVGQWKVDEAGRIVQIA